MINIKQLKSATSGPILFQGTSTVLSSSDFTWNDSTKVGYINGKLGIGITNPTSSTHIKGIDSTASNFAFKVDNLANYNIASFRNDGFISLLNNDIEIATSAGFCSILGGNYKAFKIGISGIAYFMTMVHNTGALEIHTPTVILGGSISSGDVSVNIGNYGGLSSIGVRNIALSTNSSGGASFAIGAKGQGGANGSATMRFSHNPTSFGVSGASTDNNYYRIGIGQDDVTTHRVAIADGLKVSGLSTAGAMQIVGGDSTSTNFGLIVYDIALNNNFSVRNDGSSGFGGIYSNTKVSITGSDSTGTNNALKIHNFAGTLLLQQKNNGIFYLNTTNSNDSQFQLANSGAIGFSILHYSPGNQQMYFDACYESGIIAKNTHSFGILNVGGLLRFGRASGLTPGTGFGYSTALNIDSSTGYIGINIGNATATSPLHIGGLPTYATNAAALVAGLTPGALYIRTAWGLDIVV